MALQCVCLNEASGLAGSSIAAAAGRAKQQHHGPFALSPAPTRLLRQRNGWQALLDNLESARKLAVSHPKHGESREFRAVTRFSSALGSKRVLLSSASFPDVTVMLLEGWRGFPQPTNKRLAHWGVPRARWEHTPGSSGDGACAPVIWGCRATRLRIQLPPTSCAMGLSTHLSAFGQGGQTDRGRGCGTDTSQISCTTPTAQP